MAGRLVQRLRQLLLLDILLKAYLGAGRMSDGGNALVAVQYGSNVVAAKWLDLTQKISADKCFALEKWPRARSRECKSRASSFSPKSKWSFRVTYPERQAACLLTLTSSGSRRFADRDQSVVTLQHAIIGIARP